ncbi:hypothetical protein SAMN05421823_10280 [Catalinimonas alkaloidigena]|uniref:Uncharacterized protein n=1 Tax=Catalinimonas alkaloidigena TaxID=1075417 RepID=A0A1G8ZU78_9BACT|nr:hypothetical protein [Catalinimonas alkaloidigena]SDK18174.1 hypothetical protein SAMN05421823_10280 [Catalinimonas alkaloidigena]
MKTYPFRPKALLLVGLLFFFFGCESPCTQRSDTYYTTVVVLDYTTLEAVGDFAFTQVIHHYSGEDCPPMNGEVSLVVTNPNSRPVSYAYAGTYTLDDMTWEFQGSVFSLQPGASTVAKAIRKTTAKIDAGKIDITIPTVIKYE